VNQKYQRFATPQDLHLETFFDSFLSTKLEATCIPQVSHGGGKTKTIHSIINHAKYFHLMLLTQK
jgi:hypothetical protein